MLTDDLRDAMNQATAEQPFVPDIEPALGRARRLRNRQRLTVVTSVTVVAALAAGLTLTINNGSGQLTPADAAPVIGLGGTPVAPTSAQTDAAFANWGPARGNLAGNPEFTSKVIEEWLGTQHGSPVNGGVADGGTSLSRFSGGDVHVLYAGTTPDGVAAVIDQRIGHGLDVVLFSGATEKAVRIVDEEGTDFGATNSEPGNDPTYSFYTGDEDGNELWLDPWVVSFVTSPSGHHVITLPVYSSDSVEASFNHTLDSNGQIQRTWSPVSTSGGVGIVTEPADGLAIDTLIKVFHDASPVDISPIFAPNREPRPSNLLSNMWLSTDPRPAGLKPREGVDAISNIANIGINDAGSLANTDYFWVHNSYGTDTTPYPAEPFGGDTWSVSGDLAKHWWVNVAQDWLWGDPAHTVVTLEHDQLGDDSATSQQIVSDQVSVVNARPFVATKLPNGFGWIVVGGPGSTITGYRVAGSQTWIVPKAANFDNRGDTPRIGTTRKAAILPTNAGSIEIRMDVNGQTKVVDENS